MKPPTAEHLAATLLPTHPQLAIDVLRAAGYSLGAAKRATEASGVAPFAKDTNT